VVEASLNAPALCGAEVHRLVAGDDGPQGYEAALAWWFEEALAATAARTRQQT
jgi:hypothetical protein